MSHPRIPCECENCRCADPAAICADCMRRRVATRMHYAAGPGHSIACGEPDLRGVCTTAVVEFVTCGYCLTALTGKP